MSALLFLSFLLLIHHGLGSADLSRLLKVHPTWSFKVESVDTILEKAAQLEGGSDSQLTMANLRSKIEATFGPNTKHIVSKVADPMWPTELPETFDARKQWKLCAKLIANSSDEGSCRSDGPALAASVMSDRYCIYKKKGPAPRFSVEILAGCAESCTANASRLTTIYDSFMYTLHNGIPTGGTYNSKKGCLPWTEAPCKHTKGSYISDVTNATTTKKPCKKQGVKHACLNKCSNPAYKKSFDEDRIQIISVDTFYFADYKIMNDILTYGPVVMRMDLYDDFLKHPKGVYKRKSNAKYLGRVKRFKVIGWGKENRIRYWLAVNTWNYWGSTKVLKIAIDLDSDLYAITVNFKW